MSSNEATTQSGGWYACYTRPRAEKRVQTLLAERGIDCYLPAVPRMHRWGDRRRRVVVPLFTSYVFARGETPGRILEMPGVHDIVRFDGRYALIPDDEIRNIERFVKALTATGQEPPRVAFQRGERVLITAGPFTGVEGVVLQGRDRRRVIVGLAAIGAGFQVDVSAQSVRLLLEAS